MPALPSSYSSLPSFPPSYPPPPPVKFSPLPYCPRLTLLLLAVSAGPLPYPYSQPTTPTPFQAPLLVIIPTPSFPRHLHQKRRPLNRGDPLDRGQDKPVRSVQGRDQGGKELAVGVQGGEGASPCLLLLLLLMLMLPSNCCRSDRMSSRMRRVREISSLPPLCPGRVVLQLS